MKLKPYLLNCFLLLVPIFLWNILLVDYLPKQYTPEFFDKNIPQIISVGENTLRAVVFILPIFMILSPKTASQKWGLVIYVLGTLIYFSSWAMVIFYPQSEWSNSLIGFTAPAFTTIVWFVGIGLIGSKSYLNIPWISIIYIAISLLFVAIHTTHAYLAFLNEKLLVADRFP